MRVLVDSDIFAYQCGFASQKTVYFTEEPEIVVQPVEHALRIVKTGLEAIYHEVNGWLNQSGESCKELELYLTGADNFRDKVATIRGYKENRKGKPKPVHYDAIRKYMVDHWGAVIVDGYEADDALAIEAHKEGYDPDRVCLASVDKDLKTVPGLLYSFKRKEQYLLSEEEARGNFWRQLLTGDSVDAIVGCWKCGKKRAETLIQDCMPEFKQWKTALAEYEASLGKAGCPYQHAESAAIENARLLHLLRTPDQVWSPPEP